MAIKISFQTKVMADGKDNKRIQQTNRRLRIFQGGSQERENSKNEFFEKKRAYYILLE